METGRLAIKIPEISKETGKQTSGQKKDPHQSSKRPRIIPVCQKFRENLMECGSPEEIFRQFKDSAPFILESAYGEDKKAKYSLIGLNPVLRIQAENYNRTIISGDKKYTRIVIPHFVNEKTSGAVNDPVQRIDQNGRTDCLSDVFNHNRPHFCSDSETITVNEPDPVSKIHTILDLFDYKNVKIPGYQGGLTGFFSYDLVYSLFKTVKTEKPELKFPLADFIMTSEYILFDHPAKNVYIFSLALVTDDDDEKKITENAGLKVKKISEEIRNCASENPTEKPDENNKRQTGTPELLHPEYSTNITKKSYEKLVRKTKEYIFSGDIFQGVISKKNECGYDKDPFLIYSALKKVNPGPYMYYINYGERQIIGSSPEMLVKVEKNRVTTVPIAGTRARGKNPEEDKRLENELLSDEKERAEHIMLVDLARNDIGRACEYGTVTVDEFMKIEKFSHVQHIVSTVSGELKKNTGPSDAFKSCFPAGTLTGAPKIRAMQIIDELETERRGLYGGAVGHIGLGKKTDFAIAIRTLVCENKTLTFQAGAGIVADSDPEMEYEETEKKASAITNAIALVNGGCFP